MTKPVHTVYGPTTTPYAASEVSPSPAYAPSSDSQPEYWTTTIVTDYVTYCPYATTFSHGDQTYVVTEPKTVTVTSKYPLCIFPKQVSYLTFPRLWRIVRIGMHDQLHGPTSGYSATGDELCHQYVHHIEGSNNCGDLLCDHLHGHALCPSRAPNLSGTDCLRHSQSKQLWLSAGGHSKYLPPIATASLPGLLHW